MYVNRDKYQYHYKIAYMLGLKIFVRIQTFRQRPFAPSPNFCHPDDDDEHDGCGDHDEDDDGGCGDHDDLCPLSEVSFQGLVNHKDIVLEND